MDCRVYQCTEKQRMETCADCTDFPCDFLHPYRDQAEKWHNTKIYHLCLIKKLGLEKWAEEEAGGILDKYFYGTWTLCAWVTYNSRMPATFYETRALLTLSSTREHDSYCFG